MGTENVFDMNFYRVKNQNTTLVESLMDIWGEFIHPDELSSIFTQYYLPSDNCAGYGLAGLVLPTIEIPEREPESYCIHFHDCSKFYSFDQSNTAFTQMKTDVRPDSPFIKRNPLLGTLARRPLQAIEHYTKAKSADEFIHSFIAQVVNWHQQQKLDRVIHPFLGFRNLIESILSSFEGEPKCSYLDSSSSYWSYAIQISSEECFVLTLYPEKIERMNSLVQGLARANS